MYCSSYIEFKSNGDKKKTILIKKYPEGIKPYLKDVINNFKKKKKEIWCIENAINNDN